MEPDEGTDRHRLYTSHRAASRVSDVEGATTRKSLEWASRRSAREAQAFRTESTAAVRKDQCDCILPYVDGFNHISKIAAITDVEISLVRACVQNLVYYGVVTLVPMFQYCAVYTATPKLRQLTRCAGLQRQCVEYCARSTRQLPQIGDAFRMYAAMTYGTTVKDLCKRLKPHELHINEKKLVLFGVLEGLIRRVYKYPITLSHIDTSTIKSENPTLVKTYNGLVCIDELCCQGGTWPGQLEEQLEGDSSVAYIFK